MGNPIWWAVLCIAVGTLLSMLRRNELDDKHNNLSCVNCQKRVNKLATTCPYCGKNPKLQNSQNFHPLPQTFTPQSVAVATAGGGEAAAAQDEFTVVIEDAGSRKIAVITEVRSLNSSLGLKEAKDLIESAPATVLEKADKATADKAKAALEAAGAKVSITMY